MTTRATVAAADPSATAAAVAFGVLGPLRVVVDGDPVALGGPRPRSVLALLLANAHRTVPVEYLIDAIWDDHPPETARRQVQNCVSALRRSLKDNRLAEPLIVAETAGYLIRPAAGAFDAAVFADRVAAATGLAARGQVTEAVTHVRSALDLWRGPAYGGLPGRAIERVAASLEEQRLAAIELRFELELRLDRHHEVVGELQDVVSVHPLRERLVGQLMQALHRVGRQADAVYAYQRLQKELAEELGIDPDPALQRLQLSIVTSDCADGGAERRPDASHPADLRSVANVPVPAQLPADVAGFAGRAEQLRVLDEILRAVDEEPAPGVVVAAISGTAGVGKTTLAVHWAHRVRDRFPDGHLFVDLGAYGPNSPLRAERVLAHLLGALGVPAGQIPADVPAAAGLYRSLLAGRRMLVLLDNAGDLDQILPLLPGTPGCVALVTSRDQLTGLAAAVGAHLLPVDVVTAAEASDLLAYRIGADRLAAEPAAAARIVDRCARLPLALAIVAARAAAHASFPLSALADELHAARDVLSAFEAGAPPADVRAVLSWSYQRLTGPSARLFRLLGLHPGPDLNAIAAASLAGEPVRPTRAALAELARANLVTEHVPGRFRFHDLLRAYSVELAGSLDPEADLTTAVRRLLDHYLHSALGANRLTDPQRLPLAVPAPERGALVAELHTCAQALDWFLTERWVLLAAAGLAYESGFDAHVWRLGWAVGPFLDRRGQWRDAVGLYSTGVKAAERSGDLPGQASSHRALGMAYTGLGRFDDAERHYRAAIRGYQAAGDPLGEAFARLNSGGVCEARGDFHTALERVEAGLSLIRGAGYRDGERMALTLIGHLATRLGDHERALSVCQQALAGEHDLSDLAAASLWANRGQAHQHLGDHRSAVDSYRNAVRIVRTAGHVRYEAEILHLLGDAYDTAGEAAAAGEAWQAALNILVDIPDAEADVVRGKLHALATGTAATP